MSFPLAYCPHGADVLQRLRALYEQRDQGIVLAAMDVPALAQALAAELPPSGFCEYPDVHRRARYWDARLRQHTDLLDDAIPCAYLSEMDQGLYGALVGGDAHFLSDPDSGWVSSMVAPILRDRSQLDDLSFSTDSEWFQRYVRQMQIFVEAARGKFGISHVIVVNGLNFVFELVGATTTYELLIDEPEWVLRAIDFAHKLALTVQNAFFEHVPLLENGTCSNMVQWMRGRIISESVDPFHMTSVAYFEQWGRDVLERIFAQFDGGVLHIHGNGRHLLEAVASVRGLKAIYLGDDIGFPKAFDVLDQIQRDTGDMPLVLSVPFDSFNEALLGHRLAGGVFYLVSSVPDVETANRCMDRVRGYRA